MTRFPGALPPVNGLTLHVMFFATGFYLLPSLLASWGDGGGREAFEEGG